MGFSVALAIGWFLIVIIHLNTLRRSSLSSTKNKLVDDIYSLIKTVNTDVEKIDELTFDHKVVRIERTIEEVNSIYHGELLCLSDELLRRVITFDVEQSNCEEELKIVCYEAIEHIDEKYHKSVHNSRSFLYINRYEVLGVFASSFSLYAIVKLVTWFYTGEI